MTRKISLFLIIMLSCQAFGQLDKKVAPSLVKITTAKADGSSIGESTGFALTIGEGIEIVSPYGILKNASKATVADSKGKTTLAHRITGANDLYDVARFTIEKASMPPLTMAEQKLTVGSRATIVQPTGKGKAQATEVTIDEATEHGGLTYYTILRPADKALIGCPLLNQSGQVVGVIQRSPDKEADKTFAIGIEFTQALQIGTMSAADPSLQSIYIPKQLPAEREQAASYLYLLTKNTEDTLSYLANLGDFIEKFPDNFFGYTERAAYYIATSQYALAERDYTQALEACEDKADIHHAMSVALYNLCQRNSYSQYKDWDLNRALFETEQAYALNATPLYLMQKGKCLYALKRYREAYDTYAEINATRFRSSENLFCQSRALEMDGGDSTQVLALLDSAVVRFKRPLQPDAAPYILFRANQHNRYGYYKEAALGYQEYESLVGSNMLSDVFFYNKEQVELKARLYPQALNDIEKALAIKPNEYVYLIEKALIETRTGHFEEAIYTATQAQKVDPNDPDSYKLIGISQSELGRKAEARQNLQRAYELGDPQAQEWLNSMK